MKFMSRSNGDDELNAASSNRDTQWIVDSGGAPERNIVIDGEISLVNLDNRNIVIDGEIS